MTTITHRPDLSGLVVSRFQARAALQRAGLLEMVETTCRPRASIRSSSWRGPTR